MVMSQEMLQFNLEEAPGVLIKPVKELVIVAKKRVDEGKLYYRPRTNDKEQAVFLLHRESNRVYKITEPLVKKVDGIVVSTWERLYISGFQLNNDRRFPSELKKFLFLMIQRK